MAGGKLYSEKDIEYLRENWGIVREKTIAKNLNRSFSSLEQFVRKLGLEAYSNFGYYVNGGQAAKIMGIDRKTVYNLGIPFKRMKLNQKREMLWIEWDLFIEWLEANQSKWDSRKMERYAIGEESEWLKKKRKEDLLIYMQKLWTGKEFSELEMYLKQGYKQKDIASKMGRSLPSIEYGIKKLYERKCNKCI